MGFATSTLKRHRLGVGDGWVLDVADVAPRGAPAGVVICGHAMMTDRRSLLRRGRPCLAEALASAGFRVLVPDLRGHGMSGPTPAGGGRWSYDDHVDDVAGLVSLANDLAPDLPVALVGHSLFGHVSLASVGRYAHVSDRVAAVALLAVNLWHPTGWDAHRSLKTRALRTATMLGTRALGQLVGFIPSTWSSGRAMDEPIDYWETLVTSTLRGRWAANDGFDYRAALSTIHQPALHVISDGDTMAGEASEAIAFLSPLRDRTVWHLGPAHPEPWRTLKPTHMGLVTHPQSEPIWDAVAAWLREALARAD